MIYKTLSYVVQELDHFLMRRFLSRESKAILSNIVDEAGAVPEGNKNKVIVTLVNLEHETNHPYALQSNVRNGLNVSQNLPYNFNMDVLVTALFNNYQEALKLLSETLYFFQAKHLFTPDNSPGLDPGIQKISFEVVKLSYHEAHSLWTALGVKYMPSVLFRVRMLSFQSDEIVKLDPLVNAIDPKLNPVP